MERGLTQKQSDILAFIILYQAKHGNHPTQKTIQSHFGYKSVFAVTEHINALRRKGMLKPKKSKKTRLELVEVSKLCVPENDFLSNVSYFEWLTERQNEILSMRLSGYKTSGIAKKLGMHIQTAYNEVHTINSKLNENGYELALTIKRI